MIESARPMRPIVYLLFLSVAACTSARVEPDVIREAAIRHYLKDRAVLPDPISLSIERRNPSDQLLQSLADLDTHLIGEYSVTHIRASSREGATASKIMVRAIRWQWKGTAEVEILHYNPPYDLHGIRYYLRRIDSEWLVVEKGVEWMS